MPPNRVQTVLRERIEITPAGSRIVYGFGVSFFDLLIASFVSAVQVFVFLQSLYGYLTHHGNQRDNFLGMVVIVPILAIAAVLVLYNRNKMRGDREVMLAFLRETLDAR